MRHITLANFAQYFHVDPDVVPEQIAADLACIDTGHREASKEELEEYITYFIKKVTKSTARRSDEENLKVFERGWTENLELGRQKFGLSAVRPKYFQNMPPYCLGPDGRMYFCVNKNLTIDMLPLYVKYLFCSFFSDFDTIHEFGSGSGQNLLTMASLSTPPPPPVLLVMIGQIPASGWST